VPGSYSTLPGASLAVILADLGSIIPFDNSVGGNPAMNDALRRHHVVFTGQGTRPMVFAHGFGCDQNMWRFTAPAFTNTHRTVLFDHIGCGRSDSRAYDPVRHGSLRGYALDVLDILEAADLRDVVFVGHSVSAVIGLLAAIERPERFGELVMICPSPRYLNDPPDYLGGFERSDIDGLLDMMESNMLGWADYLAPAVMGSASTPELTQELASSFCAGDPFISRRFAQLTFLADNREDLARAPVPSLIIQCREDVIAPHWIGDYMQSRMPRSTLALLEANGHCPHLTHPVDTVAVIQRYLGES
jgi:sigma-B regulation protein RsbQ